MFKNFSPKLFFIVAAVFIVISTPALFLLFPIFIVQTIYFDPARIVLYPNPNNFYWIANCNIKLDTFFNTSHVRIFFVPFHFE